MERCLIGENKQKIGGKSAQIDIKPGALPNQRLEGNGPKNIKLSAIPNR